MQAFKKMTGRVAYLPIANIDTDMIIPKQYLKTIKRTGLGNHLFAEMRFNDLGVPNVEFILNQANYQQVQILMAEENFGCGSSREHAVWSLIDFGIKVVICASFAEIFYSNCFKNGLLPIILAKEHIRELAQHTHQQVSIDLEAQLIQVDTLAIPFSLDAYRRDTLLNGLDEIDETQLFEQDIIAFETRQKTEQPWLYTGEEHHG